MTAATTVTLSDIPQVEMTPMQPGHFSTTVHDRDTFASVDIKGTFRQTEEAAIASAETLRDASLITVIRDHKADPVAVYHMGEKIA